MPERREPASQDGRLQEIIRKSNPGIPDKDVTLYSIAWIDPARPIDRTTSSWLDSIFNKKHTNEYTYIQEFTNCLQHSDILGLHRNRELIT